MNNKQILPGHIYYVNYDPVRHGEFGNGQHLSLILRKNDDGYTYLAIPMTSQCRGRYQQVDLGYLRCLPFRLRQTKTYAVVCQTRAVNISRITPVFVKGKPQNIELPAGRLKKVRDELKRVYYI